jgi:hypothetical protein
MIVLYALNTIRADDLLITVHPKYLKIYEDILLFEKIGQIPSFSYVNNNPAVALRLNLNIVRERCQEIYGKMPKKRNLYHFFFESGSTPIDLPFEEEEEPVKRYYGSDMINRVIAYSATRQLLPLFPESG